MKYHGRFLTTRLVFTCVRYKPTEKLARVANFRNPVPCQSPLTNVFAPLYQLSDSHTFTTFTVCHAILGKEPRLLRSPRVDLVLDVRQGHEPQDNLALGWKVFHVQGVREYRRGKALNPQGLSQSEKLLNGPRVG